MSAAEAMSTRVWRFCVEVPVSAGPEVCERMFTALCEAVDAAEPAERDGWDCVVYGHQVDLDDES